MSVPRSAAKENLTPQFFKILTACGLEVVIVLFESSPNSPIWKEKAIGQELGRELEANHSGRFDSFIYLPGAQWFFYHVSDLGKAMETLKRGIEARGLLAIATLLHAETAQELRVWYPPTAEAIPA